MSELIDYIAEEVETTQRLFDLDDILEFQQRHCLEIIRGADYQYHLYIDRKAYGTSLTPMMALVAGMQAYRKMNATCSE